MKITKIHEVTFSTEESIMTASLSAPNELVMLMSSGNVIRYNFDKRKGQHLFSVKSVSTLEDGGFDINAPSTVYTLDSIVVVVNDYKRHGYVHYPTKYKTLRLWRQDYYSNHSCYPIALFKSEDGVPHLIYGEAWNHIQIMNLDTRQILTASKSLIIENAEERHLEFYRNYTEDSKQAWPIPYDYFFGKLEMSPDQKNFLSAGWAWGSHDCYNVYDIEHFIQNNRIRQKNIGGWEQNNRAVCWIDNETIAVTYSPYDEQDENASKASPHEIHFYKIDGQESKLERKLKIEGLDIMNSQVHFNKDFSAIILFSDKTGVVILSLDGEVIFRDQQMTQDTYHADLNIFVKTVGKSVTVHQIKKT